MINSVLKAVEIMNTFSADHPRRSLAEFSDITGYPKTTIYTLAATLVNQGLLEKNGDSYSLGHAIIRMSQAVRVNVELRDRAAPLLRELADRARESVYLAVPDGERILYIYAIESSHRLSSRSALGDRAYYHSTSVGKAMLAFMDDDERTRVLESTGLPAMTPNTITVLAELEHELSETRSRGYSFDRSENEPGTYCIGAPILDARGRVVAACSVSGNSETLLTELLPSLDQVLLKTADQISRRMGYVPSRGTPVYGLSGEANRT